MESAACGERKTDGLGKVGGILYLRIGKDRKRIWLTN